VSTPKKKPPHANRKPKPANGVPPKRREEAAKEEKADRKKKAEEPETEEMEQIERNFDVEKAKKLNIENLLYDDEEEDLLDL